MWANYAISFAIGLYFGKYFVKQKYCTQVQCLFLKMVLYTVSIVILNDVMKHKELLDPEVTDNDSADISSSRYFPAVYSNVSYDNGT